MRLRSTLFMLVATAALGASNATAAAPDRWPPVKGSGDLFVHFGEEHLDDEDGEIIFPKVIADSILWSPDLVVTSGDKSSNGTEENLLLWKDAMSAYDRAGIPYFAGLGNHDREALPGFPDGISPLSPLGPYPTVFADRPYPFGDAPSPAGVSPNARPESDPAGASSHYAFDFGNVRWLILDNSCFEFAQCDRNQNPPYENGETTFGFLAEQAAEADKAGKLVFVNLHIPTQDPRPEHSEPTPLPHTFGEGTSLENGQFEDAAAAAGIDGVFTGHIKGQWIYDAQKVPYFIDGGGGGEVYVSDAEEVGVDYGYWHGFRLLRVTGKNVVTDAVPVFVPGGITVTEPKPAHVGDRVTMEAFGKQPTMDGPAVEKLELRSPDSERPNFANLPEPARIWTSTNPRVARPVAVEGDDQRRNKRTQTKGGEFRATCPGRSRVTITSGIESASRVLYVRSAKGRIVQRMKAGPASVAVTLNQAAVIEVRLLKGKRVVRTLRRTCFAGGEVPLVTKFGRRGIKPGAYTAAVTVRSDRKPVTRRFAVRVLG
ncbi:MAG: metallophosphoesterase [Solirubrobacteraceae bacterium]